MAARPRQRSYSSKAEKMSGSCDAYGRHQNKIPYEKTNSSRSGISKWENGEEKIVTGEKEKWTRRVNGALKESASNIQIYRVWQY